MPISKDRFERIEDDGISPGTNAERILDLLVRNRDLAFTMTEIADEADVTRGSVGPTLKRLQEDGYVDHRGTYWRVSESVLASSAGLAHASEAASMYDDGEEFDVSAWAEEADDGDAKDYSDGDGSDR